MIYTRQPKDSSLCGQSCVAMVTGKTLEEVIEIFGTRGQTNTKKLCTALKTIQDFTPVRLTRVSNTSVLPYLCILKILWADGRSHWVVYKKKKIYDPAVGVYKLDKYELKIEGKGRITSYLEIK